MTANEQISAAGTATPPPTEFSAAQAVQHHLTLLNNAVGSITNPITNEPVQVPDFQTLYTAAGNIGAAHSADYMACIQSLLGRASDFDCTLPPADYKPVFPYDHHIHAKMGVEWYYVCLHLNVTDPNGNKGRIGLLELMNKQRPIGNTTQAAANWDDEMCMVFTSTTTATLSFGDNSSIVRRNRNLQWPATGGSIAYSQPTAGADFLFQCGPDSLSGSADVLPLQVTVNDGDNIAFSLRITCKPEFTAPNAFFLQGVPISLTGGEGGTGMTTIPSPGIYYSWPQLIVDTTGGNTVTIEGVQYTVDSGSGWIDHQVLMQSLENAGGTVSPIPFVDDPAPYSGWCWQFYNLEKGDAFTGASFCSWYINTAPTFSYGYYLKPDTANGKWLAYFIDAGNIQLNDFQNYPSPVCSVPTGDTINLPTSRDYINVRNSLLGHGLSGVATPWCNDGRFNSQSWTVISEAPADYKDTTGNYSDGIGYLETVGFESRESVRARVLNFLSTGVLPCLLGGSASDEHLQ